MSLIKKFKFSTDPGKGTEPSITLHQGNNCVGSNPVNVTINSNGPVAAFFWLCGCRST